MRLSYPGQIKRLLGRGKASKKGNRKQTPGGVVCEIPPITMKETHTRLTLPSKESETSLLKKGLETETQLSSSSCIWWVCLRGTHLKKLIPVLGVSAAWAAPLLTPRGLIAQCLVTSSGCFLQVSCQLTPAP